MTGRQILACAIAGALLAAGSFGVAAWALTGINAPFCVAWRWPIS
jgi:hypothetical protein